MSIYFHFSLLSPLGKWCGPTFEQALILFTDAFCHVQWFWIICLMYFCYFRIIPLWIKGMALRWTNLNFFTNGCFVPSLVEIGPMVLKKNSKIWKVYRKTDRCNVPNLGEIQTDRQTEDGQEAIWKADLSSNKLTKPKIALWVVHKQRRMTGDEKSFSAFSCLWR